MMLELLGHDGKVFGALTYVDGRMRYEGEGRAVAAMVFVDPETGQPVLPSAGERYLAVVAETLGGGYMETRLTDEMAKSHDVSREPRDGKGRWVAGGDPVDSSFLGDALAAKDDMIEDIVKRKAGRTTQEVRRRLVSITKNVLSGTRVYVRVPLGDLTKVLDEGYKNQLQTGKSSGRYIPERRRSAERLAYGLSAQSSPEEHPVYGYLDTPEGFARLPDASGMGGDRIPFYGPVRIQLKESAGKKGTFTFSDSLIPIEQHKIAPAPLGTTVDDERVLAALGPKASYLLDEDIKSVHDALRAADYWEVQLPSFTREDIASIDLPRKPNAGIRERLDALGIPWRVWRDEGGHGLPLSKSVDGGEREGWFVWI